MRFGSRPADDDGASAEAGRRTGWSRALVGAAAAVSLVVAGLVTLDRALGDDPAPEVRGVVVDRGAGEEPAGPPPEADTTATSAAPSSTSTTAAPVTTAPPPPSSAPAPAPERRVATAEGGAFFTYTADPDESTAGSSTVVSRGEEVRLTLSGFADGGRGRITATVENATGEPIAFPDGLRVTVHVDFEGSPWRTVEAADPGTTDLAPGRQARASAEVPLEEHGEYTLRGEVEYLRG